LDKARAIARVLKFPLGPPTKIRLVFAGPGGGNPLYVLFLAQLTEKYLFQTNLCNSCVIPWLDHGMTQQGITSSLHVNRAKIEQILNP
jgi:hypothetical protein